MENYGSKSVYVLRFGKVERIRENLGASDIELTIDEVNAIDEKLCKLNTSDLYGVASKTKNKKKRRARIWQRI